MFNYVNLVIKPFCWIKEETNWTSSLLYTKPLWTEITEVIFSIISCSATIQRALSRSHMECIIWEKKSDNPKEDPINVDTPVRIVCKDNLRISFEWQRSFSHT